VRSVAETMIAAYASAIEARDVDRLGRAYPALTSAERARWSRFFRDARSVEVQLSIRKVSVLPAGNVAEAEVRGAYDYRTHSGRDGREKANFRAEFRQQPSGAWRLSRIR
jgi:ketosteroid isomerase-like protein